MLFIHDEIIEGTGGSHGVRDLHGLASAIGRPQSGFGDIEFYPDIFTKAAALMASLIQNHPFVDGNKRTGVTAAGIFLELNSWYVNVTQEQLEEFAVQVTIEGTDVDVIALWLRQGCEPLMIETEQFRSP